MLQPRKLRHLTRDEILPFLVKPGRDGTTPLQRWNARHVRRYDDPDACWLWTASRNSDGYGQLHVAGLNVIHAHQIAYLVYIGDIPLGHLVQHRCDVRHCCNPDHLTIGTKKSNLEDASAKGRLGGGTRFRMTPELVRSIRKRAAAGESKTAIARCLGSSRHAVVKIVNGKSWRHVTDTEAA